MSETTGQVPQTTSECNNILRSVILALENPHPHYRAKARNLLELLYKKQCKEALEGIYEEYRLHPTLNVRSFALEAREYKKRLES